MFDEKLSASSKNFLDWQFILFLFLALLGLGAVIRGLYVLTVFSNQSYFSEETSLEASNSASIALTRGFIYVDLAGAIKEPGIYQLEVGSRLATVINKAGGFTVQADPAYLSHDLNLAQKLTDGEKIYIFSREEKKYEQNAVVFCQNLGRASNQDSSSGLTQISINNATASDLQTLEGVGEKRAEEIMVGRPYQNLSELVERKILTESLFGKIENQLKL